MATGTTFSNPTEAQRLYARVLASWASDSLKLRRDGLDRPCQREGLGIGIAPSANFAPVHPVRRAA